HGRSAGGNRFDAHLGDAAPGFWFTAVVETDDPSSPGDAGHQSRGWETACLPCSVACEVRDRGNQRRWDREGLLWRGSERSHAHVFAIPWWNGIYARERHRTHGKGCARARHRWWRDRSHARRNCQAYACTLNQFFVWL